MNLKFKQYKLKKKKGIYAQGKNSIKGLYFEGSNIWKITGHNNFKTTYSN